ncbi:MAG: hypothetical protein ABGY71_05605 [bacterium]|jgi:hypothetical protein
MAVDDMNSEPATPKHARIVGLPALAWGAPRPAKNDEQRAGYTPEPWEFIQCLPIWLVSVWGLAVLAGLLDPIDSPTPKLPLA